MRRAAGGGAADRRCLARPAPCSSWRSWRLPGLLIGEAMARGRGHRAGRHLGVRCCSRSEIGVVLVFAASALATVATAPFEQTRSRRSSWQLLRGSGWPPGAHRGLDRAVADAGRGDGRRLPGRVHDPGRDWSCWPTRRCCAPTWCAATRAGSRAASSRACAGRWRLVAGVRAVRRRRCCCRRCARRLQRAAGGGVLLRAAGPGGGRRSTRSGWRGRRCCAPALVVLVLLNPWAPQILALLGLFDIWFDFRKWAEPPEARPGQG